MTTERDIELDDMAEEAQAIVAASEEAPAGVFPSGLSKTDWLDWHRRTFGV